jgi:hypothetical protein
VARTLMAALAAQHIALASSLTAQSSCASLASTEFGAAPTNDTTVAGPARARLVADALRAPTTFADSMAQSVVAVFVSGLQQRRAGLRVFFSRDRRASLWCAEFLDRASGRPRASEPVLRLDLRAPAGPTLGLRDAVHEHVGAALSPLTRLDLSGGTLLVDRSITRDRHWRDSVGVINRDYEALIRRLGGTRSNGASIILLTDSLPRALRSIGHLYTDAPPIESTLSGIGRTIAVMRFIRGRGFGRHELGHLAVTELLGALPEEQIELTLAIDEGISRGVGGTLGQPLLRFVCDSAPTALALLDPSAPDHPIDSLWRVEATYNGVRDAIGLTYQYRLANQRGMNVRDIIRAAPTTRRELLASLADVATPAALDSMRTIRDWATARCLTTGISPGASPRQR